MNHVLFEIGTEELPARFIDAAEQQLREQTKNWLVELRIPYESIQTYSTPRRLAVIIQGVAEQQESLTEEIRGPSEKIAKNEEGEWTKAAIGFTKGQGKSLEDIYIKNVKDTPYIFIKKHIEGEETVQLLPSFKEVISSIQFPETMRWGNQSFRFSRPIRWLTALFNDQIIPFELAGVKTSNKTYGHRFLGREVTLKDPLQYKEVLKEQYVLVDPQERAKRIQQGIQKVEDEHQFKAMIDPNLLQEVRNLVEYPTVFHGSFKEDFLKVPNEVLITSMQEHQRYFPVQDEEGNLLPYFIGVRNGDDDRLENVIRGNEKVLQARLADGQFFYEEDQKQSIDHYLKELKRVIFHEKVGTIHEKTERVKQLAEKTAKTLHFSQKELQHLKRAAEISKFDLVTEMVNEFPELQGVMGEKYALLFGEKLEVAQAIREHYLPLHSEGDLPTTKVGSLLSIADKLDTIVGLFSVGMKPTGSQDPYSLRRQALGVLRIVHHQQWELSIEDLIEKNIHQYSLTETESLKGEITQFFKRRAEYLMKQEQIESDVIDAVLDQGVGHYSLALEKAKILSHKKNAQAFKVHQEAIVRVLNLAKHGQDTEHKIDPHLFETPSEEDLYKKYEEVGQAFNMCIQEFNAKKAFEQLLRLTEPIHEFFENNMVMAEDKKIKENRLSLLNDLAKLFNQFANLSLIQWKQ